MFRFRQEHYTTRRRVERMNGGLDIALNHLTIIDATIPLFFLCAIIRRSKCCLQSSTYNGRSEQ